MSKQLLLGDEAIAQAALCPENHAQQRNTENQAARG